MLLRILGISLLILLLSSSVACASSSVARSVSTPKTFSTPARTSSGAVTLDFVEETLASFLAFFAHLLEVCLVDNFSLDFFRNFSGDFGLDALHVRGIALGGCSGKEGERRDCEDCNEF